MEQKTKTIHVELDRHISLDVTVNEQSRTVFTEVIKEGGNPVLVYAEKFSSPCNYLKAGIKKGIEYVWNMHNKGSGLSPAKEEAARRKYGNQ
ncbi:MAG: hypothetical protein IJC37_02160 [Clostridia bacterium]|nr:hypothetical protein [Clostridia bacterium]MBQ4338205.1 hypothetical protein [Clostridia bacterium]